MTVNFADLLQETEMVEFAADPRPGWAGPYLLFGARASRLEDLSRETEIVVAGVPFDTTASSRPGAAEGPAAIRQASLVFSSYVDSLGAHEMCDMRTGEVFLQRRRNLVDVGDLHIYPTDPVKTFRAVASETRFIASFARMLVLLGGDHSTSFATFAGWRAARLAADPHQLLGYVHIDHHFDFGDVSSIHGRLYHGSNSRRISELSGMQPRQIAFVGQGSATRKAQLASLRRDGFHIVPARDIRACGAADALMGTVSALKEGCDAIYLSIDIDVLDSSVAPGTGNVTLGGLSGAELLDVISELTRLPIGAIDIAEVAPRYDPTGRTPQIAARLLFDLLYRQPLPAEPSW